MGTDPDVPSVLRDAADAIASELRSTTEWGPSGLVTGQYLSDLAADRVAVPILRAAGLGVFSEESGLTGPDADVVVVLDPLDGSTNASRGLSWWATSLCAVDRRGPLAARVVDLRHGTVWTAERGRGARRDGEPIRAARTEHLADAIIGINGVPDGHGGWAQYRSLGACAPDLCAVADGTLDGYLDATVDELGPWDYLGGLLVCREAGASVVDARGRDPVILEAGARRIPVAGATEALLDRLLPLAPGASGG